MDAPARAAISARHILAVVATGYLLASWAMNPVTSILPSITADLQVDVARGGWLVNVYFLVLVGWVLTMGRMGDAFGHGRVFQLGCFIFAAGSLIAMLPGGYGMLLVGRGVQGLGSAMLFGTSLAIVAIAYQGRELSRAVGVLTVSSGISSLLGTWLSTTLVQRVSWHWTFLLPVLIGVVAGVLARDLPSVRRLRASQVDWLGGLLLFGAITFALVGVNHLHDGPETFEAGAPYHLGMHAAALGLLVAFLWRQLNAPHPLIKLPALRNMRLVAGVIANGIAHSSMLATGLLIPFLLERGRGYTPTETAQLMIVMQLSLIGGSYLGGWLYARTSSPLIGVLSLGSIAGGLVVLGQFGPTMPFPALFPIQFFLGCGLGTFTTVNNTAVMTSVAPEQRGLASGLVESTRQLGHSVGVSISSGILAASLAAAAIPEVGYNDGFVAASSAMGLVAALGVGIVLYPVLFKRRGPARLAA